jgi:hypothetical protein
LLAGWGTVGVLIALLAFTWAAGAVRMALRRRALATPLAHTDADINVSLFRKSIHNK